MEIQKIYSDCEGEKLYTVLLNEDELMLFSNFKNIPKNKKSLSTLAAGIGLAGTTAGIVHLRNKKKKQLAEERAVRQAKEEEEFNKMSNSEKMGYLKAKNQALSEQNDLISRYAARQRIGKSIYRTTALLG